MTTSSLRATPRSRAISPKAATTFFYTQQTGAESCSWTLTDGAKTAVLNFAGEPCTKSDFSIEATNSGASTVIKFV